MVNVLFELQDGIFGTYALAQEVYERGIRLDGEGIRRSRYHIKNGKIDPVPDIASKTSGCTPDHSSGIDGVLEIWSLETEMGNIFEHINPSTGGDENHLSEEL
jgi:hypothetical protein